MRSATAAILLVALTLASLAPQAAYPQPSQANTRTLAKQQQQELEKLTKEARKIFRKGEFPSAVKAYHAILDKDPNNILARLGAAYSYYKSLDYKSCYDYTQEALKLDPNNARAHALAGAALLRSGYIMAAILELNQAFKLNSKEALAYGAAAEIDYYEGRPEQAIGKALRAVSLDPDEPDYLITIARASSRMEMYERAAEAYERFLTVAPETDKERRERISGLIEFYHRLSGLRVHDVGGPKDS